MCAAPHLIACVLRSDATTSLCSSVRHRCACQDDNRARLLKLPDHLVQFILERFPELSAASGQLVQGDTCGWEAYIRVYRRLYNLLAGSDQPIYTTSDPAKDERIAELTDILQWTDLWHEYIRSSEATKDLTKEEKARLCLSHQVRFAPDSMLHYHDAFSFRCNVAVASLPPCARLHRSFSTTSSPACMALWRRCATSRGATDVWRCSLASSTRTRSRACSGACDRSAHALG